jgi:tripartite-type tricarboxylate transporter receptor subunit TctC
MNIMQKRRQLAAAALSLLSLCAICSSSLAQNYPGKPIEIMVAFQPGGGTDSLARAYAEAAKKHTSQPVVVYNRPGASGAIGLADVVNSKPDGYKIAPTLKERKIDLSIGTWRGLGVAKGTPPEVVEAIKDITRKAVNEPIMREVMDKLNLGYSYADDSAFKAQLVRDDETFRQLVARLNLKN